MFVLPDTRKRHVLTQRKPKDRMDRDGQPTPSAAVSQKATIKVRKNGKNNQMQKGRLSKTKNNVNHHSVGRDITSTVRNRAVMRYVSKMSSAITMSTDCVRGNYCAKPGCRIYFSAAPNQDKDGRDGTRINRKRRIG